MNLLEWQDYWNNRFRLYGHTGWKNPGLYAYDQQIRLKAVLNLLSKVGFFIEESKSILDIGCGSGDFVEEFAKRKAQVVGFDISDHVVEQTRKRFEQAKNVEIFCGSVESINLPAQSVDLITSITVLQHIASDQQLEQTLALLFEGLKPNGYFLLLESTFSEQEKYQQDKVFYLNKRTRVDWLELFQRSNFILVREESYPQFALTTLRYLKQKLEVFKPKGQPSNSAEANPQDSGQLYAYLVKLFLALFTPLDLWFSIPFPRQFAQQRIFLLKRGK